MVELPRFEVCKGDEDKARSARWSALTAAGYGREKQHPNGLALSGGGIRSAAFCIGVMQALEEHGQAGAGADPGIVLPNFDFVSSVSGGGYAAAGLIHHGSRELPEGTPLFAYGKADEDTGLMNSLRDHSDYLFAGRVGWHVLVGLAMYLRALVISVVALAPAVVIFAGIMVLAQRFGATLDSAALLPWLLALLAVPILVAIPNRSGAKPEKEGLTLLAVLLAVCLALAAVGLGLWVMPILSEIRSHGGLQVLLSGGAAAGFLTLQSTSLVKLAGREAAASFGGWVRQNGARIVLALAALVLPLALWLLGLWLALVLSEIKWPKDAAALNGLCIVAIFWVLESFHGFLIDIDRNSMSEFYRRGLARAFLPGIKDEWYLTQVKLDVLPYPILNASISTVGATDNIRRRNAAGFVMTPRHYGCETLGYAPMAAASRHLDLSKAMAISGAAAAPNMGLAFRAPGLAFSMAFLGLRLGRWMPHPRIVEKKEPAPFAGLRHLWLEALGLSGRVLSQDELVLLSDGGHSDDLGVTELLRRKCRLIVAVDAEQDPDLRCGALTQLMRLARIDMGITIRIDLRPMAASHAEGARVVQSGLPDPGGVPRYHAALGLIHYADKSKGYLLYIKASLTGDEYAPIQAYARHHPMFPQETTADQAFNEEQFEAYRALGAHATKDVVNGKALWVHQDLRPETQVGKVNDADILGWLKAKPPASPEPGKSPPETAPSNPVLPGRVG